MFDNYKTDKYISRPVNAKIEVLPKIKLTPKQREYLRENCFAWFPSYYFNTLKKYSIFTASELSEYEYSLEKIYGEAYEYFDRCQKTFDISRVKAFEHVRIASDLNKDLVTLAKLFASYLQKSTKNMARRIYSLNISKTNKTLPESMKLKESNILLLEFDLSKYISSFIVDPEMFQLEKREHFDQIHPNMYEYFIKKHIFKLDDAGIKVELGTKDYNSITKIIKEITGK